MKRIVVILSMLITMFSFSTILNNGYYKASYVENYTYYEMDILVRKNQIVFVGFDIKDANGRSTIFGQKNKMDEKIKIENSLRRGVDLEKIQVYDKKNTEIVMSLYNYLLKKIDEGIEGAYVVENLN